MVNSEEKKGSSVGKKTTERARELYREFLEGLLLTLLHLY